MPDIIGMFGQMVQGGFNTAASVLNNVATVKAQVTANLGSPEFQAAVKNSGLGDILAGAQVTAQNAGSLVVNTAQAAGNLPQKAAQGLSNTFKGFFGSVQSTIITIVVLIVVLLVVGYVVKVIIDKVFG